jgi:hypothetical protein
MTSTSLSLGESTDSSSDVAQGWLFGKRIETFHHRTESGALGADNVHPLAQSRLASSCDPINRPSRTCRRAFFPRGEKAVAFELVEGSVNAGAVDRSEPVTKGCIDEPVAVAWLFRQQQQHRRIDEVTGWCDDEATAQLTFHVFALPTTWEGETWLEPKHGS